MTIDDHEGRGEKTLTELGGIYKTLASSHIFALGRACLLGLQGAIAKWLRRQIRNLFLFEGAGSNPAGVDIFFCAFVIVMNQ